MHSEFHFWIYEYLFLGLASFAKLLLDLPGCPIVHHGALLLTSQGLTVQQCGAEKKLWFCFIHSAHIYVIFFFYLKSYVPCDLVSSFLR